MWTDTLPVRAPAPSTLGRRSPFGATGWNSRTPLPITLCNYRVAQSNNNSLWSNPVLLLARRRGDSGVGDELVLVAEKARLGHGSDGRGRAHMGLPYRPAVRNGHSRPWSVGGFEGRACSGRTTNPRHALVLVLARPSTEGFSWTRVGGCEVRGGVGRPVGGHGRGELVAVRFRQRPKAPDESARRNRSPLTLGAEGAVAGLGGGPARARPTRTGPGLAAKASGRRIVDPRPSVTRPGPWADGRRGHVRPGRRVPPRPGVGRWAGQPFPWGRSPVDGTGFPVHLPGSGSPGGPSAQYT